MTALVDRRLLEYMSVQENKARKKAQRVNYLLDEKARWTGNS